MTGLEQLNQAIELLKKEGVSDETFGLLAAIAACPIWSEKLDKEFQALGYKAALECYRGSNIYWMGEPEQVAADPNNPENWEGYALHYDQD